LEKRLSKHKITIFSKSLGGHGPFAPGYAYGVSADKSVHAQTNKTPLLGWTKGTACSKAGVVPARTWLY